MNVLSDLHHSGLFYSLHLLFEKRLGYKLFRPIGMEWFPEWWDIAKPYNQSIDTAKQYLELNSTPLDGSPKLNNVINDKGYLEIEETEHHYTQKAITLSQFKEMKIDIIIASIPDHWITYRKLRDKYHPKAKLICQMGNMFNEVHTYPIDNLMASTIPFETKANAVFYHQEIPIREYEEPKSKQITSFVHLLPESSRYIGLKTELKEYEWKAYGAQCPDGWMNGIDNVHKEMSRSLWGYHNKPRGDGFGWIIHSWFMSGRPVIVNYEDYKEQLAGQLMIPDWNCIDLNAPNLVEKVRIVDAIEMGKRARQMFNSVVDYSEEEKKIRLFIEGLI